MLRIACDVAPSPHSRRPSALAPCQGALTFASDARQRKALRSFDDALPPAYFLAEGTGPPRVDFERECLELLTIARLLLT
jgi:hypothetical protein